MYSIAYLPLLIRYCEYVFSGYIWVVKEKSRLLIHMLISILTEKYHGMGMIEPMIPLSFYGIVSGIYTSSAIICFLVSYFAFRGFDKTSKKNLLLLFLGFLVLGLGFLALSVPSFYVYFVLQAYRRPSVSINLVNYTGFLVYYLLSFIAYLLFALMYLSDEDDKKKLWVIFVPLWYADSVKFHVVSLILLAFILVQTILNSIKRRNLNSYLVTFSFFSLSVFHLLMLLTTFTVKTYIIGNLFLIAGFLSLLCMLIRVNRR